MYTHIKKGLPSRLSSVPLNKRAERHVTGYKDCFRILGLWSPRSNNFPKENQILKDKDGK